MVDVDAQAAAAETPRRAAPRRRARSGPGASRYRSEVWTSTRSLAKSVVSTRSLRKKSGRAPTLGTTTGVETPGTKALVEHSIGELRRSSVPGAQRVAARAGRGTGGSPRARAAGEEASASGCARLAVAPEQLHRSARGRTARSRWSGVRLATAWNSAAARLVALGVEQRASERLADRRLVGLEIARLRERDDRRLDGRRGRAARSRADRGRRRSPWRHFRSRERSRSTASRIRRGHLLLGGARDMAPRCRRRRRSRAS